MSISTASTFDLSNCPGFIAVGLVPLDEAPAFEPSSTDEAWRLGYETERRGERAAISSRDGYTAAEHLAFANGQRQARIDRAKESPILPASRVPTSEDFVSGLLATARYCDGLGEWLGGEIAKILRQAADDAEVFRARNFRELDGRRDAWIDSQGYCHECQQRAHDDKN